MPEVLSRAVDGGAAPLAPLRVRVVIVACAVAITGAAWLHLVQLHHRMMADVAVPMAAAWTLADAGFAFTMWVVMMVGMMAGPATPALLLFAGMQSRLPARAMMLNVSSFAFGYMSVWTAFSAAAMLVQWGLHEALVQTSAMAIADKMLAAAVLVAAGMYQFASPKSACLAHCRSPLGFFMTTWRDGAAGAALMGVRHGAYCLGCCWALMLVLFAVGVMNLVWVAALTVLVLLEKAAPAGRTLSRIAGGALIAAGVALLL